MSHRLLFVCILLLAFFAPTAAQTDDDCTAYIEMRQTDVEHIQELIDNLTTAEFGNFYIELSTMRQKYEDMEEVPECAVELHRLMLAQISANQDVVTYTLLALVSTDPPKYEALVDETGVRIEELITASQTELKKIEQ